MRISAKADYAIRAVAELAAAGRVPDAGPWVKTESVSTVQNIPLPFLLNILAELRTAELVRSRRGVDGGYQLTRPPAQISVADVIRAVDGPLANIAGARPEDLDYPGPATALRDIWIALRATMRSVLEQVTLADLAAGTLPDDVRGLLHGDDVWRARR